MTDEPKFYRGLAREYMSQDRIESVNWRLAIQCFAGWLDERSADSSVELKLLRCRAAGWLAAPEGESPESTRELIEKLYAMVKHLSMRSPDLASIKVEGAVLMSGTVEVGKVVAVERESDKPFPFEDIHHTLHAPECSWGCHYDAEGKLNRNPACTVHGASNQ